ncbi:glycylpeptide N-tetradecanoyltransferase-like isoform X2 [Scaptodrosophila lebanonensis]|uniref:Glycylpeptide N-tetradecanoyltransferase n=1 Tax=Drosophila lebanonensis TaxID=7225 RepID=A0A6J2U8W9_DROLE|nr:glycylpeptide N-tetradecanoyltransferase-like isoform X2 [Scaptodrosophila lebanonensis]
MPNKDDANAKDAGERDEDVVLSRDASAQTTEDILAAAVTGLKVNSSADSNPNLRSKQVLEHMLKELQATSDLDEKVEANECIEPNKDINDIQAEPYALPSAFAWNIVDVDDAEELKDLYTLLQENYVEDGDAMFRFHYQPEFLKWALQSPGWKRDWHVGVRVVKSGKLVGFISANPGKLRVYDQTIPIVDVNFLCVHKKLRHKRLAPVLIREITRRVNLAGIFQAVYTAGVLLPKPVATCRYWHRSLNPKKLIDVGFSHLTRHMKMQTTVKLYKLPEQPQTKGYRRILPQDMAKAHKLLEEFLKKFSLCPVFNEEEFIHWFTPLDGVVDCYVVVDEEDNLTDMVSYYCLPSSIMHHSVHKTLNAAYSFYNVSTKTPVLQLVTDALISARNAKMDVYNALELMDNKEFLTPLKFGIGDGNLHYYMFNWRCPTMKSEDVALILM